MTSTTRTGYCSLPAPAGVADGKARVCIASPDISGPIKNGGIGSAYKALAMALARGGHEVTILYPHGTHSDDGPTTNHPMSNHGAESSGKPQPCQPSRSTPQGVFPSGRHLL